VLEIGHVAGIQADHAEGVPAARVAARTDLGLMLAFVFDFLLEGARPGLEAPVAAVVEAADVDSFRKRARWGFHEGPRVLLLGAGLAPHAGAEAQDRRAGRSNFSVCQWLRTWSRDGKERERRRRSACPASAPEGQKLASLSQITQGCVRLASYRLSVILSAQVCQSSRSGGADRNASRARRRTSPQPRQSSLWAASAMRSRCSRMRAESRVDSGLLIGRLPFGKSHASAGVWMVARCGWPSRCASVAQRVEQGLA
jgi:hypothetical protein